MESESNHLARRRADLAWFEFVFRSAAQILNHQARFLTKTG